MTAPLKLELQPIMTNREPKLIIEAVIKELKKAREERELRQWEKESLEEYERTRAGHRDDNLE